MAAWYRFVLSEYFTLSFFYMLILCSGQCDRHGWRLPVSFRAQLNFWCRIISHSDSAC